MLKVCPETLRQLESQGVTVKVLPMHGLID
jgi:hypothetical protein